jgi:hypothetical protein
MRILLVPAVLGLAALAACDGGSPTDGGTASLTQAEAQELASAWDGVGAGVMDGFGGPSASVLPGAGPAAATTTVEFTSTRACPAGGTATVQGSRVITRGDGGGSVRFEASRTDAACAFPARRGQGTMTITTTPSVQLTSEQTWTAGQPGTRTSTQKGSFDWARSASGATGSCTVDLTATWTPATHTYTLNGTFCNRTVSVTRTRTE